MTRLERREQALLRIVRRQAAAAVIPPIAAVDDSPVSKKRKRNKGKETGRRPALDFAESESLPYTSPELHHHISSSRNHHFHLPSWLSDNTDDPAVKVSALFIQTVQRYSFHTRTSFRNYRIICYPASCTPIRLPTTRNFLPKNEGRYCCEMTGCIVTRQVGYQ
jgi:hypothetical protein